MSGTIVFVLRLLVAVALYGFLAWALVFLWREVQKQSHTLATRRVPGISLTILYGDGLPTLKHFAQAEIILGRDPLCDVPLPDDTVSTRHARLSYHHAQWWIEDLGSMNGTLLNGTKLSMPTVITSGDEISCGATSVDITLSANVLIEPTIRLEKGK